MLEALFGPKLLTKSGTRSTQAALGQKKLIFVYFTKQFDTPCQSFMEMLADMYFKHEEKEIEVVFVSSDVNEENFANYYFEMPWAAVPYARDDIAQALRQRFAVEAVPTVAVLKADGECVTNRGHDTLRESRSFRQVLQAWLPANKSAQRVVDLLGDTLLTKEGPKPTSEVLNNKLGILLYFSAHWCPPCREFTPLLADSYSQHTANDFEVVFVSNDQDDESFAEYFSEMPWVAVPFSSNDVRNRLCEEYSVRGIPKLVVLDNREGELEMIAVNGVSQVRALGSLAKCAKAWGMQEAQEADPAPEVGEGANSPFCDLLGTELATHDGVKPTAEVLQGKKAVLLYFSAHWCPPCRGFTPQLADKYRHTLQTRTDVEVVFVSSDRSHTDFQGYFSDMPWTAVPYDKAELRQKLGEDFGVRGIPTLVVLNARGDIVNQNGRREVAESTDLAEALGKMGL